MDSPQKVVVEKVEENVEKNVEENVEKKTTFELSRTVRIILCVITLYLYITIIEWFIHKHIMHNEKLDPGHIRHHRSVNVDMTLSKDEYVEDEIRMGSSHTLMITVGTIIVSNLIINKLYKLDVNIYYIFLGSLLLSLFYRFMWNTYHRKMHFEFEFFEKTNNPYLKWIFMNHAYHHLQKGDRKGNFNILFPGGDFIMGDYRTNVDNTEYCKKDTEHRICKYNKVFNKVPSRNLIN